MPTTPLGTLTRNVSFSCATRTKGLKVSPRTVHFSEGAAQGSMSQ